MFVIGAAPEARERIRRAVEPFVPRGDAFDVTRLEAVRRRVRGLERVNVGEANDQRREIPIVVSVERR